MSEDDTSHSIVVNLLSHFFVNLRETSNAWPGDITTGASVTPDMSTMTHARFDRVVGNLAGSLSYDTNCESETDEDEAENAGMEGDMYPDDGLELEGATVGRGPVEVLAEGGVS